MCGQMNHGMTLHGQRTFAQGLAQGCVPRASSRQTYVVQKAVCATTIEFGLRRRNAITPTKSRAIKNQGVSGSVRVSVIHTGLLERQIKPVPCQKPKPLAMQKRGVHGPLRVRVIHIHQGVLMMPCAQHGVLTLHRKMVPLAIAHYNLPMDRPASQHATLAITSSDPRRALPPDNWFRLLAR